MKNPDFPRLSPTEIRHLGQVLAAARKRRHIRYNLAAQRLERTIHKVEMMDRASLDLLCGAVPEATPAMIRGFAKITKCLK